MMDEEGRVDGFPDTDGDGWGDSDAVTQVCPGTPGYAASGGDCDESDPAINPGAVENCGGLDEDCDGSLDEAGATGVRDFYRDHDGDGYGRAAESAEACAAPPGYAESAGDCWDDPLNLDAALVHPNADYQSRGYCQVGAPCLIVESGENVWRCAHPLSPSSCSSFRPLASWDYDCSGAADIQVGSACFGGCSGACACSGGSPGTTSDLTPAECGQVINQVTGCSRNSSSNCTTVRMDLPLRCR